MKNLLIIFLFAGCYSKDIKANQADTIVYLSKSAGVVSDADITINSTTFGTNNTTAIQNILDIASHTKSLKVIWDVKVSGTGWVINSNTLIQALPGNGAILRNNSNKPLFRNADTVFAREPINSNITIDGGVWNGNNLNQAAGTTANGSSSIFAMYGVRNFILRNFTIYRQRAYSLHGINIRNGLVENGTIDYGTSTGFFADGIHFDGYSENCVARKLKIRATDDGIAINADDLYRSVLYFGGKVGNFYYNAAGPVNNIRFEDIYLDSSTFGLRILSGTARVDNIVVRNLTGNTKGYSVIIDNYWANPGSVTFAGPGNIGTVTIENNQVNIYAGISFVHNSLIDVNCNVESLILKDIKRNYYFQHFTPSVYISGSATRIKSLVIDGYDAYDTTAFRTPHIYNEGIITSASISRANIKRKGYSNASYLFENIGSVKYLLINGVNADSINAIYYNHGTTATTVNATNIIHKAPDYSFSTKRLDTLTLSNYVGTYMQAGTFAVKRGDAFYTTAAKEQQQQIEDLKAEIKMIKNK